MSLDATLSRIEGHELGISTTYLAYSATRHLRARIHSEEKRLQYGQSRYRVLRLRSRSEESRYQAVSITMDVAQARRRYARRYRYQLFHQKKAAKAVGKRGRTVRIRIKRAEQQLQHSIALANERGVLQTGLHVEQAEVPIQRLRYRLDVLKSSASYIEYKRSSSQLRSLDAIKTLSTFRLYTLPQIPLEKAGERSGWQSSPGWPTRSMKGVSRVAMPEGSIRDNKWHALSMDPVYHGQRWPEQGSIGADRQRGGQELYLSRPPEPRGLAGALKANNDSIVPKKPGIGGLLWSRSTPSPGSASSPSGSDDQADGALGPFELPRITPRSGGAASVHHHHGDRKTKYLHDTTLGSSAEVDRAKLWEPKQPPEVAYRVPHRADSKAGGGSTKYGARQGLQPIRMLSPIKSRNGSASSRQLLASIGQQGR